MSPHTPSLLKQLLGAGVGMMVALALYKGYGVVSPHLEGSLAYLFPPGTWEGNPPPEGARLSKKDAPQEMTDRRIARARVVVERLSAPAALPVPQPAPPVEGIDDQEDKEEQITDAMIARRDERKIAREQAAAAVPAEPSDPPTEEAAGPLAQAVQEIVDQSEPDVASKETTIAQSAPALPSSGVTLWIAVLLALVPSVIMVPRVRRWMVLD